MILVTGANGFVGRAVCRQLADAGIAAVAAWRGSGEAPSGATRVVRIPSIGAHDDFGAVLAGCRVVVHLAARVHVMGDESGDALAAYRQTNVDGTLNLARQAVATGVRRFVFLSTAKVLGEEGDLDAREAQADCPDDPYSRSKFEAEQGLREIAGASGLELVVLRPPLVYGPGVKANFLRLLRAVDRGWPLPLGAVSNRRSMIYVGNLADAIITCTRHPAASGRTYLVSDGDDPSTPELVRRLAANLGRPARLLPVPVSWLRGAAQLAGRRREVDRLVGSLYFDGASIRAELGWTPPVSTDAAIAETVRWYRAGGF